ncbi:uncharacterized protein LOC100198077 isoform X1 [Hydra vulgaris]|uniref:uncharacterized protein LOC100198077 isoform X1 n=2 Tax=Hydra vulgaris TaxID=6087 RepID=UPI0032E9F6E8
MHLFLKNGNQQRWLVVNLDDGNIPMIVGLSNKETSTITINLEPAIWFKVMLLESVSIDCSTRVVSWTNGQHHKGNDAPATYSLFGNAASCYDFDDDIDELFTIAIQLIENNPLLESDEKIRNEKIIQYEQSLFRMMHCYILSKIIFEPRDLPCVIKALNTQKKVISKLDDQTLIHSRLVEFYSSKMTNIREQDIAPSIETLLETNMITKKLSEILLLDIKKAEALLRQEVDYAQKMVDILKNDSFETTSQNKLENLLEARKLRDIKHGKLETLIITRATIHNGLTFLNDENELNESCRHYLNLHNLVVDEKKLVKFYMDQKVRALSVRECIQTVISDLEKGLQSCGEEFTVDGKRITDVMDGLKSLPEWQTLTQQIASMVYDTSHPIGNVFKSFYQNFESKCKTVLKASHSSKSSLLLAYEDYVVVGENEADFNKYYLDDQKNLIMIHLYNVTEMLSSYFTDTHLMFMRKVRLCYERCFYDRIGRYLMHLYYVAYAQDIQSIKKRVIMLKQVENKCNKLGLQINNEWWLSLLESDTESSVTEDSSSDSNSYIISFSDCDEEEYHSSDSELYLKQDSVHKIKRHLKKSKKAVLLRSMKNGQFLDLDDSSSDLIKSGCLLLKNEVAEKNNNFVSLNESPLSYSPVISTKCIKAQSNCHNKTDEVDTFEKHFDAAVNSIKNTFSHFSPLKKMQCLTKALQIIANKVEELRMRDRIIDRSNVAVGADDLLPLLALIFLKMTPNDIGKLYVELLFISDLMADFLSSGCHSYALCEFQIAFRVLDQTCEELSLL